MLVVITYDVETTDSKGESRLRHVAKVCGKYGLRVQNSVFEVLLDPAQLVALKNELSKEIDPKRDSIRIYRLGKSYENRIETMGKESVMRTGEPMIL